MSRAIICFKQTMGVSHMKKLEKNLRYKIVNVLWLLVWGCIILDICFFLVFYFTDDLGTTVPRYVLKYLCLPFTVNMLTYLLTKRINNSDKYSHDTKNLVCSLGLCTLGGSMGIFHSYYTPLWCIPCMTLLFCTVFHSKKIHRVMLIYNCLLVFIATLYICLSRPDQTAFYVQHCVVVLGIIFLSNLVANEVEKYQTKVNELTRMAIDNEEKYRKRLETDLLTGVHSREYMQEIFNNTFGIVGNNSPVGIAMLDLDNFKNINDKYGHDNGDKVLKKLGQLLNEFSSDFFHVGRFGGEEFVVVFHGEPQSEYAEIMNSIRQSFSETKFDFMEENITFSAGILTCNSTISYETAFHLADQALYKSKSEGKNCITVMSLS